jgi:hypothetical protein
MLLIKEALEYQWLLSLSAVWTLQYLGDRFVFLL